ncbi:UNVERIFIED_CONTAM: hypothetical protein PYX00_004820 [Menopon gallinae]|uniref:Receptor ligand binding region domain-containing protein n=1 Tax=Menopon gallinae TaxID=328185 RepID=A0AAW2I728_9NEOP
MKALFDMIHEGPHKLMLFGAACTQVTDPIAKASKHWRLTQLSYADTHPMFTNDNFPNFFRIVPSENAFNPPRLKLLQEFNWTRVGTIYQNEPRFSLVSIGYCLGEGIRRRMKYDGAITAGAAFGRPPSTRSGRLLGGDGSGEKPIGVNRLSICQATCKQVSELEIRRRNKGAGRAGSGLRGVVFWGRGRDRFGFGPSPRRAVCGRYRAI